MTNISRKVNHLLVENSIKLNTYKNTIHTMYTSQQLFQQIIWLYFTFCSTTMTENLITYAIAILIGILAIFSFTIGIDKMIRIILGNYILNSICIAASQSINIAVQSMKATPDAKFLWLSYDKISTFLDNGSMTIILIVYIILLIIIYKTSKIRIVLPSDEAIKKMVQLIFVPLTVISIVLTLQIVILWINGINISEIASVTSVVANNPYMLKFISLTPVRILLHGILTILITSEFKVSVKTDF